MREASRGSHGWIEVLKQAMRVLHDPSLSIQDGPHSEREGVIQGRDLRGRRLSYEDPFDINLECLHNDDVLDHGDEKGAQPHVRGLGADLESEEVDDDKDAEHVEWKRNLPRMSEMGRLVVRLLAEIGKSLHPNDIMISDRPLETRPVVRSGGDVRDRKDVQRVHEEATNEEAIPLSI